MMMTVQKAKFEYAKIYKTWRKKMIKSIVTLLSDEEASAVVGGEADEHPWDNDSVTQDECSLEHPWSSDIQSDDHPWDND